jgi:hypothetical protein
MTNPLLRPDDPRFKPKKVADDAEANPFSEGDAVLDAEATAPNRSENTFAPAANDSSRPFLPQYVVTAEHRGWLLLLLDLISLGACLLGVLVNLIGYVLPLLGIMPAVVVVFLAAEDLRMMRLGGRNPDGRSMTLLALVVGAILTIAIATMCGLFYYFNFSLFPGWLM